MAFITISYILQHNSTNIGFKWFFENRNLTDYTYLFNDKWTWTANGIGAEGARMISEALKINPTLTALNLSCDEKKKKWK